MATGAFLGATDVGRRIRACRRRAGLTRAQVAEDAGMAVTYLAYLESDPDAAPTPTALTRLAAALGTTRPALAGAGVDLPPGRRPPEPGAVLEPMSEAECRARLAPGGVGRFVFSDTRGPVAIPVSFSVMDGDVVFRTGAWTRQSERGLRRGVSFEVDHIDEDLGEGWSVLVSGRARLVTDKAELDGARALGIAPWAGGARETYIRVVAAEVTGRRLRRRVHAGPDA